MRIGVMVLIKVAVVLAGAVLRSYDMLNRKPFPKRKHR